MPPSGAVGRIACTLSANVTETLPAPCWTPSKALQLLLCCSCRLQLAEVGYNCLDWQSLLDGLRPRQVDLDEMDPGVPTHGWQFFAAQASERHFRKEVLWPRLAPTQQALMRSQSGPFAGLPFWAVPSSPFSRFPPQLFCVLLLRRWPPPRSVLEANRGFSVESAAARVCREAGARVSTNLFVRDLDLPVARHDGRRLEVVADGLPLFNGAQFPIHTTLVSRVRADGLLRRQCAHVDGAALAQARRVKQHTSCIYGRGVEGWGGPLESLRVEAAVPMLQPQVPNPTWKMCPACSKSIARRSRKFAPRTLLAISGGAPSTPR